MTMPPPGDPTRVRNQKAIQSGPRWTWLIAGALLAIIAIVTFAFLVPIAPAPAWIGIALQGALLVALVVTSVVLPAGRARGVNSAVIMGGMAVSALVLLLIILAIAQAGGMPAVDG
ncbi:hypothetical protein [Microbacterium aurantiacum]|uniref:Uncharacterized protein n=1 Tax=Microbacterium aurantiacum TaxID=162393 RepID=A0A0M8MKL4_9MICO|nr:hypothetical protein [Microbacterium chocolatum]ANG84868.1 hypothetical protein A8L33_05240 [Microbacterium chocolatum]KOS12037.1 hypothetical protein XI38_01045 [Microbacterium chocolatum]